MCLRTAGRASNDGVVMPNTGSWTHGWAAILGGIAATLALACGTGSTSIGSPSGIDATGSATVDTSAAPTPAPQPETPAPETPAPPGPVPPAGPASFRVTGEVVDALDQVAVSNATVSVLPDGPNPPSAMTTGAQGEFDILVSNTQLPVHTVITIGHAGYTDRVLDLVVSADVTADVQLDPAPFTLSGWVRDESNWEVPRCDTQVTAVDGPSAGASISVVPRPANYPGDYQLPNLQPGTFTVRAWANGYYIKEQMARLRGFAPFDQLFFTLTTIGTVGDYKPPTDCSLAPQPTP